MASASGNQIISDVIGKERATNIFGGLIRDISTVSSRLDDKNMNSTVLAPSNSELQKLPHKPWEDPEDYNSVGDSAYTGQAGEDRAHRNLRRFVEAHVVPQSPWAENEKVQTLNGNTIWWETKDGKQLLQPGGIEISSTASHVGNGEVWVIQGVVSFS
ncbi:MAG: hypothetical protein MMC23_005787 [Stictis urceolatum]|nr:hypothetical protein [Stictis urceolata]